MSGSTLTSNATTTQTITSANSPLTIASGVTLSVFSLLDLNQSGEAVYTGDSPVNATTLGGPTLVNNGVILDTSPVESANEYAIQSVGAADFTLVNHGLVSASNFIAVGMNDGKIVNANGGTISGTGGLKVGGGTLASTVVNAGLIQGSADEAIYFTNGAVAGIVTNFASGIITGGASGGALAETGILLGAGTITNAGTISHGATAGYSVDFSGAAGNNALVLDPGQALHGIATASGAGNVLMLAGTSFGTLASPGNYFGFNSLTVAAGADWEVGNSLGTAGFAGISTIDVLGTLDAGGKITGATLLAGHDVTIEFTGVNAGNSFTGPGSGVSVAAGNQIIGLSNGDTIIIGPGAFNLATETLQGENDGTSFGQAYEFLDANNAAFYVPYSGTAADPLTARNLTFSTFGDQITITVGEGYYTFTGNGDSTLAANYAGGAVPPASLSPEQILIVSSFTDTIDSSAQLTNNSAITITGGALLDASSLAGAGIVTLENGGQLTLANTLGTDSGQTISFATGGTSLALDTLDLSGTSAGFGGTIAGFGTNDAIILTGSVMPSLGLGGTVSLNYAGSLLTVAEVNAAGSVTASTTLNVGTGYSTSSFVALLGTAGLVIETPATVDEVPFTFTGAGGTTNFENPTGYAGGLAPGNVIAAGETVLVTAPATLAASSPLTNNGSILISGSQASFLDSTPLAGTGTLVIANSGQVTLSNTLGSDAGQTVSFGTGGTSLALDTLDLSGTAAGFGGTIAGFGLNDAIILTGSVMPSLGLGGTVSLSYAGSLLTVAEVNAAGSVTASTTLNVGTGYSTSSFVALLGTAGLVIETPATVDEVPFTFTGAGGTTNFENPIGYAGGLAPGNVIAAGETVLVTAPATLAATSPLTNNGSIIVSGSQASFLDSTPLAGTGTLLIANSGQVTLGNTLGTDAGQVVSFGTGGTSLALNTLDLSGTAAGFGGTIAGFGTNDAIILTGSVMPSLGLGGTVSLNYAGSLLTVAEVNAAGSVTASTTLNVGTGYSTGSFIALLGTAGLVIETPATVDETPLTFTGAGGTTNFETPTGYAGGLAPGNSIAAGETVLVTAPASLAATSPLTNNGSIIVSGSHASFVDTTALAGAGTLGIANSGQVTLGNTLGTDAGQVVSFGTGGMSLALNTLDLSGTSAGFGGTIAGFGLNDAIILTGSVMPSLGLGGTVSLSYAGSLLTVSEVNAAGSITASTTLDVGTGYSTSSFVALLGTAGLVIETPATVDETPLTFTGAGGTTSFENPTGYAGGLAPGNVIAAGETVLVTAPATLAASSPLTNNGSILVSGSHASFLDPTPLAGTGTLVIANSGQVTVSNTLGTDAGQTVSFGTGGTSLALNTLDLSGTSSGFGGTIAGFGLNDAIILTGSVMPSLGLGGTVSLSYAGSLLTVAEVNAAGSVTASTTLDVGTGYSTSSFVALLGTAGVVIETPATVDESTFTFTGTGSTSSFEDPTDYAGGLAPGNSIVAGETVVVTAAASLASPLDNSGTIVVSGATLLVAGTLSGTGAVTLLDGGQLTLANTIGADTGQTVSFATGGTSLALNTLELSGASAGFGGTIANFGLNDAIVLSGSVLPAVGPDGSVSLQLNGSLLTVAELDANGSVTASTTLDVGTGYSTSSFVALLGTAGVVIETPQTAAEMPFTFTGSGSSTSFQDSTDYTAGIAPGSSILTGETVLVIGAASLSSWLDNAGTLIVSGTGAALLDSAPLTDSGTLVIDNSGVLTLANTMGTDAGQIVSFGTGGGSTALNTLELSGSSAGFGGTIANFGLNDAIVLSGSVLPAVGPDGSVSLQLNGSLLTVAELDANGTVTATTTLDVGPGYSASDFVALLGTAGVVIETPATVDESPLSFTGTGDFEDPGNYAGGLAPGDSLAAGETVLITGAATLGSASPLTSDGDIIVSGTAASFLDSAALSGTGTLSIIDSGQATLANTLTAISADIAFGADGTLTLDGTLAPTGTISNFLPGDGIILAGLSLEAGASVTSDGTIATIVDGGVTFSLDIPIPAGEAFHLTAGADGLVLSATPCFMAGTRIRTENGEVPVQELRIGDRVITRSGAAVPIKWLGRRAYRQPYPENSVDIIPILICRNALGPALPVRDLYVSPLHAMYLHGVLVPAGLLVNGRSIRACPDLPGFTYIHIELAAHDIIFAEGAPAETFVDCDSRQMFENAAEFAALYPDDAGPQWRFCAKRVESGPALRRIWRQLAGRAGLTACPEAAADARLLGRIDQAEPARITGWAFLPDHPDEAVELEVLDGQGVIARIIADRKRPDLAQAGFGNGRHGFELRLPERLAEHPTRTIRVRRAGGAELARSPIVLPRIKKAKQLLL